MKKQGLPKTPRRACPKHGKDYPCTCAMGNLYRFVEPVVLLLLKKKGRSYGYDLSNDFQHHALTDAEIERAALYRTLRKLEANATSSLNGRPTRVDRRGGYTSSLRRGRSIWKNGHRPRHVSKSMARFVRETARVLNRPR